MANSNLQAAKKAKNDEFYTMYEDIEREMNAYIEYNKDVFRDKTILLPCDDPEWSNFTKYFAANFERLGLKKLISTSYAKSSGNQNISKFEQESPKFDAEKNKTHGKVFILEKDKNKSGRVDYEDIEFEYLQGDGDFRSEEVTKLRDEADVIITNPPFSKYREFLAWVNPKKKSFIVISNMNAITYKEVFPLIKDNIIWLGTSHPKQFKQPDGTYKKFGNVLWMTNVDHQLRHEPLQLMTMEDNLKYNKKLIKKLPKDENGKPYYPKYDNYDAIECPCVDGIPNDYLEDVGVPITYLQKHSEEQYEIVGADFDLAESVDLANGKKGTGRFYLEATKREREDSTLQQSYHQEETVELSESQSHSLTNSVLSNSKSLDSTDTSQIIQTMDTDSQLEEGKHTQESSSNIKCNGVIGVPITFLDKFNPEQFEIIGMTQRGCHDEALETKKYDNYWEMRQDGTKTGSSGGKTNGNPNLSMNDGKHNYFINKNGHVIQSCYQRILIKHKEIVYENNIKN